MAEKLGLDDRVHNLKFGKSFDNTGRYACHSIRYDFKPASVDTSKVSKVQMDTQNSVTVTVPHVEGSGTKHTIYKGNKRPTQKECVLIIDHRTGEITLEKLSNTLQLKKTRIEGSSKAPQMVRPVTPSEQKKKLKEMKNSPSTHKKKAASAQSSSTTLQRKEKESKSAPNIHEKKAPISAALVPTSSESDSGSSDSDSEPDCYTTKKPSDTDHYTTKKTPSLPDHYVTKKGNAGFLSASDSDSDDNDHYKAPQPPPQAPPPVKSSSHLRPTYSTTLSEDLRLSDSSDSD